MFRKALKIKSNNQLRASDRKYVVDMFSTCYPKISDNEIKEIFPRKESISLLKIETYGNALVEVYLVQKRAVAFKVDDIIFPTVYTLWKRPDLMISFTTYVSVLLKLKEGADLMLPGVKLPTGNRFNEVYGTFLKGTPACVNLESNKAPVAVGITACSSGDMLFGTKGKCMIIYHTVGDKLCCLENQPVLPIPELSPPLWIFAEGDCIQDMEKLSVSENLIAKECSITDTETSTIDETPKSVEKTPEEAMDRIDNINDNVDNLTAGGETSRFIGHSLETTKDGNSNIDDNKADLNNMDELLQYCFLSAVKFSTNVKLPILTSTFYKTNMLPHCVENATLDIKKSSYKKLSNFLKRMTNLGIISVQETKPGVDSIVAINTSHPMVTSFKEGANTTLKKENSEMNPVIQESYTVTAAVLPIFNEFGLKKGSSLQAVEVRQCIKEYISKHNLQDKDNPKKVKCNDTLRSLFKAHEFVTWEELHKKVFTSMGSSFKVQNQEAEVVQKGKLEPITLSVAMRTGNKKVTLVDNLEIYGINIELFAKECQQGVAASTSISNVQGKKSRQLLIQGNQINFIATQLINKYKIPKRYISGTENAPKKKRK